MNISIEPPLPNYVRGQIQIRDAAPDETHFAFLLIEIVDHHTDE